MEYHPTSTFAGVLSFATVLTACAPLTQYRTKYELCDNDSSTFSQQCQPSALQALSTSNKPDKTKYLLGFIEFDDQGQLWDRDQMSFILDTLKKTQAAGKDLLIVVFVHGWKHSAAPQDDNIETFRQVLKGLADDEEFMSNQTQQPERQVVGIYLGWRGLSVTLPVVKELTFWERKNTAQKVGHGGITEVLNRIELIKREKDSTVPGGSRTRLVIIGHSFGGAVVHTAVAQILESRFVRTSNPADGESNIEGFGNLIVLINPAFEALLFSSLSDMAAARQSYSATQLPVMVVLTSEADYATRYAFPVGRTVSTLFEKTRPMKRWNAVTQQEETIDEANANVTAVGHFEPYRTHTLYPSKEVAHDNTREWSSPETMLSMAKANSTWQKEGPGSKILLADLTLERTMTSAGRNPYLVIRVDKELIPDHNRINNFRIIQFIRQVVLISTQPPEYKALMDKIINNPNR